MRKTGFGYAVNGAGYANMEVLDASRSSTFGYDFTSWPGRLDTEAGLRPNPQSSAFQKYVILSIAHCNVPGV